MSPCASSNTSMQASNTSRSGRRRLTGPPCCSTLVPPCDMGAAPFCYVVCAIVNYNHMQKYTTPVVHDVAHTETAHAIDLVAQQNLPTGRAYPVARSHCRHGGDRKRCHAYGSGQRRTGGGQRIEPVAARQRGPLGRLAY